MNEDERGDGLRPPRAEDKRRGRKARETEGHPHRHPSARSPPLPTGGSGGAGASSSGEKKDFPGLPGLFFLRKPVEPLSPAASFRQGRGCTAGEVRRNGTPPARPAPLPTGGSGAWERVLNIILFIGGSNRRLRRPPIWKVMFNTATSLPPPHPCRGAGSYRWSAQNRSFGG